MNNYTIKFLKVEDLTKKTLDWYKNKKVPEVVLIDIPEPQPKGTWSGGKEELGAWKNGKKHGLWTTYYSNQQVKDIGTYENGIYNGKWTFYYENGKKEKEGTLKDGNADEKWVFYNEKGNNRKQVLTYDGNKYENGLPDMEWKDGKVVGS